MGKTKTFSEKELRSLLIINYYRELLKDVFSLKKKEINPKGRSGKQEEIVSKTIVNIGINLLEHLQ